MSEQLTGKCMCGAIVFSMPADDLNDASACHCSQCRRWTGHFLATVNGPLGDLKIEKGDDKLKWYRASSYARRGFCGECGSSLFWNADGLDEYKHRIAIALGALDAPTGIKLKEHIFVADKGDYYDIGDGLVQKDKF